ncbi:GntR family transcriptional regulator [Paenibacillus caseinilyticus]|uniref:GntR family transcriptional regulator n=1 Tax=Paenibacillus mucilaginosus K02 TaxID=997761 RepID=I0BIU5_9BACL|nr:GntR family transcriptional regulator [Paenibacillus mucilaginosus]AFH62292.1 GntR family transcriptional regulator [Paenibacillus mucilaginosus K02]
MLLHIDDRSSIPIWEQIVRQIKELILKKVLQPNEKLLSVRELASMLLVNPNTVSKAYQELERQQIIETRRGKGTFVTEKMSIQVNDQKIDEIRQALKQLVIESSYIGLHQDTLVQWINGYFNELGGKTHVDGSQSE